ncbi:hypothetical protein GXP67_21155 [Rhodocytophaga rosea]|uniref:Uncharacterized protein n=1 Tax=Rhodocytophaga rosea TaxID=2704465 RepID=A0A6C0GLU9_9BACT|nr:hypothetical protein [Rhodocytophaga rosea]QHT68979.1 hypothetical protein GXP67_21155 [Rhodocytophaga rosea]
MPSSFEGYTPTKDLTAFHVRVEKFYGSTSQMPFMQVFRPNIWLSVVKDTPNSTMVILYDPTT